MTQPHPPSEPWDIDARGLRPPASKAERIARDRRYERMKRRSGGGVGGDFLLSVMAVLLPSVRHVVEERRESRSGVRLGDDAPGAPRFAGRVTLQARRPGG